MPHLKDGTSRILIWVAYWELARFMDYKCNMCMCCMESKAANVSNFFRICFCDELLHAIRQEICSLMFMIII